MRRDLVAEGKTKKIWLADSDSMVDVESKPMLTAGDGERKLEVPGKDAASNTTTANVFMLLRERGIQSHFCSISSPNSFLAQRLEMIPFEVVVRGVAFGSYVKRNPHIVEGARLENYPVEIFYKDDKLHDPLINLHKRWGGWFVEFHNAKKPLGEDLIKVEKVEDLHWSKLVRRIILENPSTLFWKLEHTAYNVFRRLEGAWSRLNMLLVDLKVEFGIHVETGKLLLGDTIDNDQWRLWEGGDPEKMLDKEVFRRLRFVTDEDVQRLKENYERVAELTTGFFRHRESSAR